MILWIIIESLVYFYTIYTQQFHILNIFIMDGLLQAINFLYSWFCSLINYTTNNLNYDKYDTSFLEYIDETMNFEDNFFDYGYKINFIDKLTYFSLLICSHYLWNILTWFNSSLITINSYSLLFMSLPMIYLNLCKSYYFIFIVQFIKNEFYKLVLTIICKLTALFVNKFTLSTFGSKPNIEGKEFEDFYENIIDDSSGLMKFIRNFFILTIVHLFKNTDNKLFSALVSIIYNYQINGISLYAYTSEPSTIIEKRSVGKINCAT